MKWWEVVTAGAVGLAAVAVVLVILLYASGKSETVRVVEADDNVRCAIVSRGSHVSIDCWVLEERR